MTDSQCKLDEFANQFDELAREFTQTVRSVAVEKEEHSLHAHQAEWHVKCMIHHCDNLHARYTVFAEEVSKRASTGASVVWMYSPDFQVMLFEFYALLNIARITLDNLRVYVAPMFKTPFAQLPKSVRDFAAGDTDCPVYELIRKESIFEYLIDCRNCVVHYRSFATSDNAIVIEEGFDASDVINDDTALFLPMARAEFRRIDTTGIAVNVFLPDQIFEHGSGGKRLPAFTYDEKFNLLSMSSRFVNSVATCALVALKLLCEVQEPTYTYAKRKK